MLQDASGFVDLYAITKTFFRSPQGPIRIFTYELPGVAPARTGITCRFNVSSTYGMLQGIAVACTSTSWDFSLRTVTGTFATYTSRIQELISLTTQNLKYDGTGINKYFHNDDSPSLLRALYGVLINRDSIGTGDIRVELTIRDDEGG